MTMMPLAASVCPIEEACIFCLHLLPVVRTENGEDNGSSLTAARPLVACFCSLFALLCIDLGS